MLMHFPVDANYLGFDNCNTLIKQRMPLNI